MKIRKHTELEVYKKAHSAAMEVFQVSKGFPKEETYSLTDQMRRSSRSVCANLAEAWRKRRYEAAFVSKLSDVESEASETQVWLEFANRCGYLDGVKTSKLDDAYDHIVAQVVSMIGESSKWVLRPTAP